MYIKAIAIALLALASITTAEARTHFYRLHHLQTPTGFGPVHESDVELRHPEAMPKFKSCSYPAVNC